MWRLVLDTIRENNMLTPGDCLIVGVSGGADSVSMLHLLAQHRSELQLSSLVCCHLHHGIRGQEADRDQEFVKNLCAQFNIPFFTERKDIPLLAKERGISEESCGREERYAFFHRTLEQLQKQMNLSPEQIKIATAHTLSDSEETLFLNLLRGSGLRGLCGIPPIRGHIIRPFIACTRQQVEAYCQSKGLSFVTDSTNSSTLYFRNRLRRQLMPVLHQLSPAFDQTVLRLTDTLRKDAQVLDQLAAQALESARWTPFSSLEPTYSRSVLSSLPEALGRRCCALLIRQAGGEADYEKILLLWHSLFQGGGVPVHPGRQVLVTEKKVLLRTTERSVVQSLPVPLKLDGCTFLGDKRLRTQLQNERNNEFLKNLRKNPLKNCLDYDRIIGDLFLRVRKPGDRIHLAGSSGGKPLKKLFWERQVPVPERDRLLVLSDDLGVCWVEGFGCDCRVAVEENTSKILWLFPHEEKNWE